VTVGRSVRAAAGVGCLAALLLGPAPAQAAGRSCVAVIVDSGAGVSARCTTWTNRLTGVGALSATGHSYRYAPSGLLCAIDGFPADCHVDDTHFWSYWHRAPAGSAWGFSGEGAGTYHPAIGSTEGWAYQNGSSRQPPNIPFATICPTTAPSPTPTPRPSPPPSSPAPTQPPHTHPPAATQAPATAAPQTGSAGTPAPGGPLGGATTTARPKPLPSRAAATVAPATAATTAATAGPTPAAATPGAASTTSAPAIGNQPDARSQPPAGPGKPILLAGLGLVAAAGLGTAAWRRTRMRS